jgi:hypothetical protein
MPSQRIPRTSAHAGVDARQLAERLRSMQPGDEVTYAELSALIGVDVQVQRGLLQTARKLVRQAYGLVFDVRTNVGLVCLSSPGMVGFVDNRLERLHRASGRVQDVLACVNPAELTPVEKHRWLAQQSVTAAVGIFAHAKTVGQLAEGGAPPALPVDLEAYRHVFQRASASSGEA